MRIARGPTKVQHHEPSGRHPAERVKLHTVHFSSIDGSGNPVESLLESPIAGKTLKLGIINFNGLLVYICILQVVHKRMSIYNL